MLNIVVPMAGKGTAFIEKGYTFPKPLMEIKGKPMVQIVVENLKPTVNHQFIYLVRKEHIDKYALNSLLQFITPGCTIIPIENDTKGAACTALLAKEYIDNDDELIIANADQYLDMDVTDFVTFARENKVDGALLTFYSTHPKWSFARATEDGVVEEVAEKKPISDKATVGVYYYKQGKDFCAGAENMIRKDVHVNGEFFVCPVYNEMLLNNKTIKIYDLGREKMHGLGTPEDYEHFLKSDIVKNM